MLKNVSQCSRNNPTIVVTTVPDDRIGFSTAGLTISKNRAIVSGKHTENSRKRTNDLKKNIIKSVYRNINFKLANFEAEFTYVYLVYNNKNLDLIYVARDVILYIEYRT